MKLFDDCGVINYTKNIGPFSTNTDLGNINVSFRSSCSLFNGTVSGKVINRSNAAVTNGHVKVTAGNNTFNAAINNGGFSISYSYFSNSISTARLTAYDSNTGDSAKPVPINGLQGSVNIGQVIACTAVTSAPVASFTYSVSGPFVPVTVNFSNTSTNAISWMWDFGDGVTSTVQNPSHTYSTAGDLYS